MKTVKGAAPAAHRRAAGLPVPHPSPHLRRVGLQRQPQQPLRLDVIAAAPRQHPLHLADPGQPFLVVALGEESLGLGSVRTSGVVVAFLHGQQGALAKGRRLAIDPACHVLSGDGGVKALTSPAEFLSRRPPACLGRLLSPGQGKPAQVVQHDRLDALVLTLHPQVQAALEKMGYDIKPTDGVARVEAIVLNHGILEGGTESRLHGKVSGY